jgi:N-acetylglucosaminyl-diphospho-decaprenol L-rhamnosyltransferase
MKASVIISLYNNLDDLHTLLPSLERQKLDGHEMEVIIRDDGSSDGSSSWVKSNSPWVTIITGKNVGFSKSNNIAAYHATGDALVFVNADTILDSRFVVAGLRTLETEPETGGVNCNMIMPWIMKKQDFIEGARPIWGYGYFLSRYGFAIYKRVQNMRCDTAFLSGGGCFIRREALGNDVPFSEDLCCTTSYCEDLDLSFRLIAKGWQVRFEPTAVLYHNQRPIRSSTFRELKKFFKVSANRITVYAANFSLSAFIGFLPYLLNGLPRKVSTLNMPKKWKKSAVFLAMVFLPVFLLFVPYWVYRNIVSSHVKLSIKDVSFFKETLP